MIVFNMIPTELHLLLPLSWCRFTKEMGRAYKSPIILISPRLAAIIKNSKFQKNRSKNIESYVSLKVNITTDRK